ncbi:MAG: TlpA disulfide reductase family protein [Rhodospirillales bacterium]|jgi:thiol-disulfide isomerase/thioredoxin
MNRRSFIACLAAAGIMAPVGIASAAKRGHGLIWHPQPMLLSNIAFQDAAGLERPLSAFEGKAVVINFWASWCLPCVVELPSIDRLKAAANASRFDILAVSVDIKGRPAAETAFRRFGIKNLEPFVDDRKHAVENLAIPFLPTTLLIDRQGREAGRYLGAGEWDGPEAGRLLDILYSGEAMPAGFSIPKLDSPKVAP